MAKEKELKDLFLDTLKDIYFAEKKILSALPKMAKAAQSPKLKAAFEKHLTETDHQVERLDQVFASIDEAPKGKTCDAIMGIIEEGKEIMDEYKGMPALDAGLLAAAQAVEHYEISRYGTLKTWASELGYKDAVKLLDATLKEEKETDSTLSELAESEVNHMRRRRKPHKSKVQRPAQRGLSFGATKLSESQASRSLSSADKRLGISRIFLIYSSLEIVVGNRGGWRFSLCLDRPANPGLVRLCVTGILFAIASAPRCLQCKFSSSGSEYSTCRRSDIEPSVAPPSKTTS
jgi:ferritin-like metal-binding protein YciE